MKVTRGDYHALSDLLHVVASVYLKSQIIHARKNAWKLKKRWSMSDSLADAREQTAKVPLILLILSSENTFFLSQTRMTIWQLFVPFLAGISAERCCKMIDVISARQTCFLWVSACTSLLHSMHVRNACLSCPNLCCAAKLMLHWMILWRMIAQTLAAWLSVLEALCLKSLTSCTSFAVPTHGDSYHALRDGNVPPLPSIIKAELQDMLCCMMHPESSQRPTARQLVCALSMTLAPRLLP